MPALLCIERIAEKRPVEIAFFVMPTDGLESLKATNEAGVAELFFEAILLGPNTLPDEVHQSGNEKSNKEPKKQRQSDEKLRRIKDVQIVHYCNCC